MARAEAPAASAPQSHTSLGCPPHPGPATSPLPPPGRARGHSLTHSVPNSDTCASLPAPTAGLGTDPKRAWAGNHILHFSLTVSFSKPVPGRSQDAPSVPRPLSHRDAASSFLDIHASAGILAGWEGHSPTTPALPLTPTELCQMVSPRDPPFG